MRFTKKFLNQCTPPSRLRWIYPCWLLFKFNLWRRKKRYCEKLTLIKLPTIYVVVFDLLISLFFHHYGWFQPVRGKNVCHFFVHDFYNEWTYVHHISFKKITYSLQDFLLVLFCFPSNMAAKYTVRHVWRHAKVVYFTTPIL